MAVLCAIEPAIAAFEAVRQAAALAGGGPLVLAAPALPLDRSAETHVAAARFIAARAGADATVLELPGDDPVAELLEAAEDFDALVVVDRRDDGAPGRLAGIARSHAPCPVLVARTGFRSGVSRSASRAARGWRADAPSIASLP
jgi:nucleotide-binding universal stress UspA family protein